MIPISDENPVRLTPYVTWLIVAGCIAFYVWEVMLGARATGALNTLGFVPARFWSGNPLQFSDGSTMPGAVTILLSMFLHGGILHLAGNMLYLWIFGNNIEDAMGHGKYTLFYLACGAIAALTMAFVDQNSLIPMVGASGAISGILASYVLLYPRARVRVIIPLGIIFFPFQVRAVWVVGLWFLTQLFMATLTPSGEPGVAWWAHVGGFAAGLVLTPILKSPYVPFFGPVPPRGPWR